MTAKLQFYIYFFVLHLTVAGAALYFSEFNASTIILTELLLIASLVYAMYLVKRMYKPIELIADACQTIADKQFGSRIVEVNNAEMKPLVQTINSVTSDLQRQELQLGEQRGFLDKLMQAAPIGIINFDFDNQISSINPFACQLLGRREKEMVGKPLPADIDFAKQLSSLVLNQTQVLNSNSGKQYRSQLAEFYDRSFRRRFLLVEEITQEVRSSEKNAFEKVLRMMSHEVNNSIGTTNSLLASCLNYQQQIREDDRDDYVQALEVVIDRNQNLGEFTKRLAGLVQIPDVDPHETNLNRLINHMQLIFSQQCKDNQIDLHVELPECDVIVFIDSNLFEQALINIIKNAIEAICREGRVVISVTKNTKSVELNISDSAGALTNTVRQHIFSPFYSTKPSGQGIGLTLVREILERHHISYSLDGIANQITEFRMQIPVQNI